MNMQKQLEHLFNRYSSMLFAVAVAVVKSREEAEDIVQELFTTTIPDLLRQKTERPAHEWGALLTVTAQNRAIDRYRRAKRFAEKEADESTLAADMGPDKTATELNDILEQLEPRYREVITLKYIAGYTWEEMSALLGLSTQGIRKRASIAMALVRKWAKKETRI